MAYAIFKQVVNKLIPGLLIHLLLLIQPPEKLFINLPGKLVAVSYL